MSTIHLTSADHFGQNILESPKEVSEVSAAAALVCGSGGLRDFILLGESVAVRRLRSQIQRIAPYFRTALIRGEAGAGKEAVARALHALSPVADGPFLVAHAAELAESSRDASSLLESIWGGTLYLSGVGDLPIDLQRTLFRFLRDYEQHRYASRRGRVDPVGTRGAETRLLVACDRDLRTHSAIGQFREDLYARLSAVEIFVPPLRQRVEDIPVLADALLRRIAEEGRESAKLFAADALAQMQERPWPDNLRGLERLVVQAAALAEGEIIEPRHLLTLADPSGRPAPRIERLHDVMQHHVFDVLSRCGGNKLRAAELLGISRSTLYRMLDAGRPQASR
ncbi:MAG TPA: sigma 54-interacting transcriptional regulator [Acidobacteriaceae bacterium]